jgi:hypothetical protein
MKRFSVIEKNNPEWSDLISKSLYHDVYHTQCYHLLEQEGEPLLLVAKYDNDFLALPMLLRKVGDTGFNDLTSSYGFSGPVSNLDFKDVSGEMFSYFRSELKAYFKSNNIVAAFSRLHPMIIGDELFSGMGTVLNIKDMVAIDLRLTPEAQIKQYRKSNRSEINDLRNKKGYTIKEADSENDVDVFVRVYQENMERVSAKKNYLFGKEYFLKFLNNNCFKSKLLLAVKDGQIAAGAVFAITNKFLQYHLAATRFEYIRDSPMKLILDEARLQGNTLDLEYMHLGGSVGNKSDDSLFRFKSGFSDLRFKFRVWQYIVHEVNYNELLRLFNKEAGSSSYFPLYRT